MRLRREISIRPGAIEVSRPVISKPLGIGGQQVSLSITTITDRDLAQNAGRDALIRARGCLLALLRAVYSSWNGVGLPVL